MPDCLDMPSSYVHWLFVPYLSIRMWRDSPITAMKTHRPQIACMAPLISFPDSGRRDCSFVSWAEPSISIEGGGDVLRAPCRDCNRDSICVINSDPLGVAGHWFHKVCLVELGTRVKCEIVT